MYYSLKGTDFSSIFRIRPQHSLVPKNEAYIEKKIAFFLFSFVMLLYFNKYFDISFFSENVMTAETNDLVHKNCPQIMVKV